MYAASAGLKTHMQNLNVIGNNIANVNTYGYKASRAVFKTSLYTSLKGGSNGTIPMGGTNPSQIGYGSNVASVDIDVSSGNYAVTGIATDLMLDGDGFFMVGSKDLVQNFNGTITDATAFTSMTLTRVGDFQFRADGYLGKNDGNVVYGFLCTGIVTEDMLTPKVPGENGELVNNPNFRPELVGMKVGDAIFSDQLVPIRYPRMMAAHYYALDEKGDYIYEDLLGADGKPVVGEDGEAVQVKKEIDPNVEGWDKVYDLTTGKLRSDVSAEGHKIAYPNTNEYYPVAAEGETDADVIANSGKINRNVVNGALHDAGYSEAMKDSVLLQAEFTGISVDPNTGIITATNSDTQEVVTIGCIAIGKVTNPNGVTNIGDNYYKAGPGTGKMTIGITGGNAEAMGINQINRSLQTPDANGLYETIDALAAHSTETKVISNGLEMSKTDLAQEISMMILTQRGYQANTRIITVTDSMLEELVNMKR